MSTDAVALQEKSSDQNIQVPIINNPTEPITKKAGKKQRGGVPLTRAEVERLFDLRAEGKTTHAISEITGHHRLTIERYLKQEVGGHPLTPLDATVAKLRNRMLAIKEFDLKTSLLGDLVLIDEYRDRMIQNLAADRYPAVCDSQEIKRLVDAKAVIARLPREIAGKENDMYAQLKTRMGAGDSGAQAIPATDFEAIGEAATEEIVGEGPEGTEKA